MTVEVFFTKSNWVDRLGVKMNTTEHMAMCQLSDGGLKYPNQGNVHVGYPQTPLCNNVCACAIKNNTIM